jgi:TonB-linked SusC/RagA family outer membrane protein
MRIASALVIAVVSSVRAACAQTPSLLDRAARLDVREVSLAVALQQLADRSRVSLVYSPSLLPATLRVSCACASVTTRQALDSLLAGTRFTFRESEGHVILVLAPDPTEDRPGIDLPTSTLPPPAPVVAASTTIVGRVTSDAGAPIANAVVTLPSATTPVLTNDAGTFRIVINADRFAARAESLRVVRLGYRPTAIEVRLAAGRVDADVVMSGQVLALDQVVVTGTAGNQERRAQSALVASIDAPELLAKAPARGVNELMFAQTPGVSMTVASGTSGANTRIDIRGQASISLTNYPLVFVDGIRVVAGPRSPGGNGVGGQTLNALDDLNPDDVQRIEVVKGPAAATLYGADASAGVIQILTKKGRPGSRRNSRKTSIELDQIHPNFTPYDNYGVCRDSLVASTSLNPLCRGQARGAIVKDNVLARNGVFGNGHLVGATLAAQGGGDAFGYYVSAETSTERGTTPASSLSRRSGRLNMTWLANPRLTLDANVGLVRTDDHLPKGDQDVDGFLFAGDFGSPLSVTAGANGALAGGFYSPTETVQSISAINTQDQTTRLTPNMRASFTPVRWWSNRLTVGLDVSRTLATQQYPRNDFNWYSGIANTGQVAVTEFNTTLYTVDYLGNVSGHFGRRNRISSDLSFGSQWINAVSEALTGIGQGLVTNSNNLVSGATTTVAGQSYAQSKSLGYFAQQQFGLDDRLFVQVGARVDRNSAFGSRIGTFLLPKIGASWIVSEEPFWRDLRLPVSTFRLRVARGTTGRSPSSSASLQTFVKSNYVTDAGVVLPGVSLGNPGNTSLRPERGTELEAGVDAGFFGDRLGIEGTYFDKRSKDLLLQLPIAPSSGYVARPYANIGEVANSGIELALRATPIARRDLTWDVVSSLNTLQNRIVSMGDLTPFANVNNQCFKPGYEIGAWCVPRVVAVDTVNKRALVTDTAENVGGQLPRYEAALGTTVTVRRSLRLYAQLDGKFAFKVYNLTRDFRDRVQKNSAEVNLPAGAGGYSLYEMIRHVGQFYAQNSGAPVGATLVRDPYIGPGDFVRLRELAATWTLPTSLASRVGVEGSSLTVGGRNLWLATKYSGWDPEVNGADIQAFLYRADVFTTPQTRRVFARLTVQF